MDQSRHLKFTCKTCGSHELTVTHVWNLLSGNTSESWKEWGPLEAGHHWHYEFKEKLDMGGKDKVFDMEGATESDEYFVNCTNCDREIIFGWSHLDHCGSIFPVEFADFDPFSTWPDPKYVDVWQGKVQFHSNSIRYDGNFMRLFS